LREWIHIYLEYIGVGVVAAVWATPFVVAQSFGWTHWSLTAIPVVGAFATSLLIWRPYRRESTLTSPAAPRKPLQLRDHR